MFWRTCVASISLVFGIGLSTRALCASVAELSPGQRQKTECMISVLSNVRGVKDPKLNVSGDVGAPEARDTSVRTILTYQYRNHGGRVGRNSVDITDLITDDPKQHMLMLPGLVSVGGDLNDLDLGMPQIAALWQKKCILDLVVLTE